MLRAGQTSLVDGNLPQQVQTARADIRRFPQQIFHYKELHADVVLLNVRRAVVPIKREAKKGQTRHEYRKLILGRQRNGRNERILDGRIRAEYLQIERRREQRVIDADV